ncbi:hypothetical protein [Glycomyces rhizosphaerae]|uniref:SPW repeat-containing protein n=1 Tax=Glycomyces rhizosphaerae TaxID=2054422 RepID=A0ABV7Q4F3_9ACTN
MAEDEQRPTRTGKAAFGAALGIWVAQALTIALVFLPFWNASGSSSKPESIWEGYEPALVGLLVAPVTAMIIGAVLARALHLRTVALYALAPVAALGSLGLCGFGYLEGVPLVAFLIGMTWNVCAVVLADKNARSHTDA